MYLNVSSPVPLPKRYVAFRGGAVASSSTGSPVTTTRLSNATAMSTVSPGAYVPLAFGEETLATRAAGDVSILMPRRLPGDPGDPGAGSSRSAAVEPPPLLPLPLLPPLPLPLLLAARRSSTIPGVVRAPAPAYSRTPSSSPSRTV